ncbi:MAG: SCP2 sterol-binding domain-containing protein [Rhodobacteraceae bacterium]|jgi:putative sterol carrier protein|nr:SCP2 sterol-binding domain-containing protein [Paracoccaceae bacterium]
MSQVIDAAVEALGAKLTSPFDGVAKFVILGEGAVMIAGATIHAGDEPADVTLTASPDTFRAIVNGNLNPTTAFMTGKLSIDGNMKLAVTLGSALR